MNTILNIEGSPGFRELVIKSQEWVVAQRVAFKEFESNEYADHEREKFAEGIVRDQMLQHIRPYLKVTAEDDFRSQCRVHQATFDLPYITDQVVERALKDCKEAQSVSAQLRFAIDALRDEIDDLRDEIDELKAGKSATFWERIKYVFTRNNKK